MTKDSLFTGDKRVVFRETFTSEEDTIRLNKGKITSVVYNDDGTTYFSGVSSNIDYGHILCFKGANRSFAIRLKLNFSQSQKNKGIFSKWISGSEQWTLVVDYHGTNKVYFSVRDETGSKSAMSNDALNDGKDHEILGVADHGVLKLYIDGKLQDVTSTYGTINNSEKEVVIGNYSGINYSYIGTLDLVEAYNDSLNADEAYLLNENLLYTEPKFDDEILSVDVREGIINNKYSGDSLNSIVVPEIINTNTEVVRDGSINSARFNGVNSKLDCGNYDSLAEDITILSWFRSFSNDEEILLSNEKLKLKLMSGKLYFTSNNSTNAVSNSINNGDYHLATITRTSLGETNIYIDRNISGSINQSSGTPVEGSNLIIGNLNDQTKTFNGNIPVTKIVKGILTTRDINQYYNSTEKYFKV